MKKFPILLLIVVLMASIFLSPTGSAQASPEGTTKTVYLSMNKYCANGVQMDVSASGSVKVVISYKAGGWKSTTVTKYYDFGPGKSMTLKPTYLSMSGQYGTATLTGNIVSAGGLRCK